MRRRDSKANGSKPASAKRCAVFLDQPVLEQLVQIRGDLYANKIHLNVQLRLIGMRFIQTSTAVRTCYIVLKVILRGHSPTRCAGMGWNGMGCAGNSMYFKGGVHK